MSVISAFWQLLNNYFQEQFGPVYIFRMHTNRNMLLNVKQAFQNFRHINKQFLHFFFAEVL